IVVDLAVEHDPDRLVLVRHRLFAAGAIDDRQPPVSERRIAEVLGGTAIRPAVTYRGRHGWHGFANFRSERTLECDDPADTAHTNYASKQLRYARKYPYAIAVRLKCRLTRKRPASPRNLRRSGSLNSESIAAARAPDDLAGVRMPVSPL